MTDGRVQLKSWFGTSPRLGLQRRVGPEKMSFVTRFSVCSPFSPALSTSDMLTGSPVHQSWCLPPPRLPLVVKRVEISA